MAFLPKIYFPQSIFCGEKGFSFLKTIQNEKKTIVVSDAFQKLNAEFLQSVLGENADFFVQEKEPATEDFNNLKERCLKNGCSYLVAVGGGSVLDLAKLVKKELGIKMVAIPTTLGSGAEASQHALLSDNGVKKISSSLGLVPETVILSPACLKTLSDGQIVSQSIDALSHGLESLVSRISNPFSDVLALSSVEIIYGNLEKLSAGEPKENLLESFQIAGILAGIAQSSAATGLCHSFAHYFGPKNNMGHSSAVATFLLDVLDLNSGRTDKYKKLDQLKNLSATDFVLKLQQLFDKLGVKQEKIVISGDIKDIAQTIKKDICTLTNPYSPSIEDIVEIIIKHQ